MSAIEWTEQTWNPVTGCTKISAGCKHCYAETMAKRLKAMGANGYENGFKVSLHPSRLEQPVKRKKPTVYFVNSMSDLFHPLVPDEYIKQVFDVMRSTPQHTYQVLTKRAGRMRAYFEAYKPPSDNAWLGVSVENRVHGLPRINDLRQVPAKIRFLSVEPLLEDLGQIDLSGIHWVIVGGESGFGARPMEKAWAENVKRQCDANSVDFFFKQWGAFGVDGKKRNKKANGRILQERTWDAMPAIAG